MRKFVTYLAIAALLCLYAGGHSAAADTWKSPRSYSDEWPKLGASGCAEYGGGYGYHECTTIGAAQKPTFAALKPAPFKAAIRAPKHAAAPVPPLPSLSPRLRAGHIAASAAGPAPEFPAALFQAKAPLSCEGQMEACFTQCRAKGGRASQCNADCTTDVACALPVRLNYAQFLAVQGELMQYLRHKPLAGEPSAVAQLPSR